MKTKYSVTPMRVHTEPVAIYKKVGYKAGAWHDVSWWDLILQPTDSPPEETLLIEDALQREDFQAAINSAASLLRS